ncbi:MAG: HD domain-containing protein [Sporomusaceae bacterium]|nr:HD domain-containing protein [Sporomusaceae bacterium]
MRKRYLELLASTGRPGRTDLASWLESTDFFTAPASTQYHGAHEGGLLEHSLAVYNNLCKIAGTFEEKLLPVSNSTAIIVALLHDICKADFYTVSTRNVKNEQTGQWEKVPYYAIEDTIPLGHGEKSVILAMRHMPLTGDEIMAIRWHMAGFDDAARQYASGQALAAALKKYPLITALHMADLAATYFDGK